MSQRNGGRSILKNHHNKNLKTLLEFVYPRKELARLEILQRFQLDFGHRREESKTIYGLHDENSKYEQYE